MTFRLAALLTTTALAAGLVVASSAQSVTAPQSTATRSRSSATFVDQADDVRNPKLDIRRVTVVNRADELRVRVFFPGTAHSYEFPQGAVMVYLDTDVDHVGPEFGHFMDFWSDYRFAPTSGWAEQRVREWSHSPEGRCVADAGVKSDKQSRLRWFEYVVVKRDGCFQADAVRVAVSTINVGELSPYREYRRPIWDHLTGRRAWSAWVPEVA